MKSQNMITPAIAGLFLLVPFVFLLSGVFGYSLGIEAARWPIEILYPDSASEGRDSLTDMVILLGPVVAVALLGFSLLRSGWDDRANGIQAVLVLANSHRITAGMLLMGLTIGAAFMLYGFVENWPCLIGQQIQC